LRVQQSRFSIEKIFDLWALDYHVFHSAAVDKEVEASRVIHFFQF
jgi:hypothetical protein